MGSFNWRLLKTTDKDANGRGEVIKFAEIWYDDNGNINGYGDCELDLNEYAELDISVEDRLCRA